MSNYPKKTRITWNDIVNIPPTKTPADLFYWYEFVGSDVIQEILVREHEYVNAGKLDTVHSIVLSTNTFERFFASEEAAQGWIDFVADIAQRKGWSVSCSIHDA